MEKFTFDDFLEIFANDEMNMPSPIWNEKQNKGQALKSIDDHHSIATEKTTFDLSSILFDPYVDIHGIKLRKTTHVDQSIQIGPDILIPNALLDCSETTRVTCLDQIQAAPLLSEIDSSNNLLLFDDGKTYSTIVPSFLLANIREEDRFASSGIQEEDGISAIITAKRKDLEVPWKTVKKPRTDHYYHRPYNFSGLNFHKEKMIPCTPNSDSIERVKEMIYQAAVMRPVNFGPEKLVEKPRRKNVKISKDPQTMAARIRRERIGDRLRVLQRLVPGGTKMDTASMLDEASSYIKYLKSQLSLIGNNKNSVSSGTNSCSPFPLPLGKASPYHHNPLFFYNPSKPKYTTIEFQHH